MPARNIDLSLYRDDIAQMVQRGLAINEIHEWLMYRKRVPVSKRTLESRISNWGIGSEPRTMLSVELLELVIELYHLNVTDGETTEILILEGYRITYYTLGRVRRQLGLKKRIPPEKRDEIELQIAHILK